MLPPAGQKSAVRADILARRHHLGAAARASASREICNKISELPQYQQASTVAAFAPMAEEVDLWPLIDAGLTQGKTMLLPRVADAAARRLSFHRYHSRGQLVAGYKGILEPAPEDKLFSLQSVDFFIIPAVAIDAGKNRLGYGGGFYDTVLAKHRVAFSCAPVFRCQLVDALPHEEHDQSVDIFICESGT